MQMICEHCHYVWAVPGEQTCLREQYAITRGSKLDVCGPWIHTPNLTEHFLKAFKRYLSITNQPINPKSRRMSANYTIVLDVPDMDEHFNKALKDAVLS
jgi:hypothetical protein